MRCISVNEVDVQLIEASFQPNGAKLLDNTCNIDLLCIEIRNRLRQMFKLCKKFQVNLDFTHVDMMLLNLFSVLYDK